MASVGYMEGTMQEASRKLSEYLKKHRMKRKSFNTDPIYTLNGTKFLPKLEVVCAACGRTFHCQPSRKKKYCNKTCFANVRRSKPRPQRKKDRSE